MPDLQEIKDEIKVLKADMKEMESRLKELELKQAYADGQASKVLPTNVNFERKLILKLVAIIASIIVLGTTVAGIVGKVIVR